MTTTRIPIDSGDRIPAEWGRPRLAKRKTTVAIREPLDVETFDTAWGRLSAVPGEDWVAVEASGEAYPIKKTIFAQTYEEVAPGRYRKAAPSRLVPVPMGHVAVLATREGEIEVAYPDFVVIGAANEVYANAAAWVEANLEFVS